MKNKYLIEKNSQGNKLVLIGSWDDDIVKEIDKKIVSIELNYSKGWRGDDVDFVHNFANDLLQFGIVDLTINNISSVNKLNKLKSLKLNTYCKTEIDIDNFPELETLKISWRSKLKNLDKAKALKNLFIYRYGVKNLDELSNLLNLEKLWISVCPAENIDGLSKLINLKILMLARFSKLDNLEVLKNLNSLEELELDTCNKVNNLDALGGLTKLKKLILNNLKEVKSIKFIENLSNLEDLEIMENTNIEDGDLSPILKLKKLKRLVIANRPHYSHTKDEMKKQLGIK